MAVVPDKVVHDERSRSMPISAAPYAVAGNTVNAFLLSIRNFFLPIVTHPQ